MSDRFTKCIALHASPVLAGLKSSNLISISLIDIPDLFTQIDEFRNKFGYKLHIYVLRIKANRALILIYKEDKLKKALFSESRYEYLLLHGFPKEKDVELYLEHLKNKINNNSFPHEIGIFLDYDLYDTIQFENNNDKCLYVGYWKVYKDKDKKIELFDKYTKCRNLLCSLIDKGYSLESLIV